MMEVGMRVTGGAYLPENVVMLRQPRTSTRFNLKQEFAAKRLAMLTAMSEWLASEPAAADVAAEVMATVESVHDLCVQFSDVGEVAR